MKRMIGFVSVALILSGCATARLSKGPESFALTQHPNAVNVGVAKVVDERTSANVGTIGAAGIRVKQADLSDITTNYLVNSLNTELKTNVTRIVSINNENAATVAGSTAADVFLATHIKRVKIFSADALMQPVEVNIDMELTVYDKAGKTIYTAPISGTYEKRIGISIVDKATGQLVESTVQDAVNNLIKDSGFRKAIGLSVNQ